MTTVTNLGNIDFN